MVFKKRLDYRFNCFNVPIIPRAPRSLRRRAPHKRTVEDSQICAFELLASLAGKLLQESEISSASSNASGGHDGLEIGKEIIKQEVQDEDKLLKTECNGQGTSEVSVAVLHSTTENSEQKCLLNEFPNVENDTVLECTSMSGCLDKVDGDLNSVGCESKKAYGNSPSKLERGPPNYGESCGGIAENGFKRQQEAEGLGNGGLTMANKCHSKDPTELCMTFPALINSRRDVKLPSCGDPVPGASFSRHRNNIKLGSRDDDENFSRCNKFNNKFKAYRPPTRIGDRRIRKLLTSKYWKVAPKLKDFELPRADLGIQPLYRKRKMCYSRERCQHDTLYKKRKFSDRSSVVTSDGGFSSESVSNSPENGMNGDKDSHVKFSIKSFRVPELLIEVPESATVGSLKRTVMETVTALLGGVIRVGVLVQGKKIRDDNRTLAQTGISSKENLDTLGFTLEPSTAQAPTSVCSKDYPLLLPCDATTLSTSPPATSASDSGILDLLPDPPPLTNSGNHVESSHELLSSDTDTLTDRTLLDSKALVPVPAMSVEALAVVPVNQKIRRSELAQRRTRRPFSVSEVEALVQAVEELGTGRWRDVKLRAFEDADHRTYVDLKDKWKTLVHTARISPQQRRGEPVPQELLDRVLAAHGYWSQHQAKQQGKHQAGTLKITDAQAADRNRVGAIQLF